MEMFAIISRYVARAHGTKYPEPKDLNNLPADAPQVMREWKEAIYKVAGLIMPDSNTMYHERYEDGTSVLTITCYGSRDAYTKTREANAEAFANLSTARRKMAEHLGLVIDIKEATIAFEDIVGVANYADLDKLFENIPDDRIHARSAPQTGA